MEKIKWTSRGMTDDVTQCEICGKIELRGTVHIVTEDGDEIYAGTTCAARKLGTTPAKIRGSVKAWNTRMEVMHQEWAAYFRRTWKIPSGPVLPALMREYGHTEDFAMQVLDRSKNLYFARQGGRI